MINMDRMLNRYHTCVDPAIDALQPVIDDMIQNPSPSILPIWQMLMDLKFYKSFFWGPCFTEDLLPPDWMLQFTLMAQKFRRTAEEFKVRYEAATAEDKIRDWEPMSFSLRRVIQESMPDSRELCRLLLHGGVECKLHLKLDISSREHGQETLNFMALIRKNIPNLLSGTLPFDPALEQNIATIVWRMAQFARLLRLLNNWPYRSMRTVKLIYLVHNWASTISHLAFLHWANRQLNESLATSDWIRLFCKIREGTSRNPNLIESSLDVLKRTKSLKCQSTMSTELFSNYIHFLLELMVTNYSNAHIQVDPETMHETMVFLLSFFMDSSNQDSKVTEWVLAEINAIISKVPSVICVPDRGNLYDLLFRIDGLQAKLRDLYGVSTLISSYFDFPRINPTGFLDSLLKTLQKMLQGGVDFIPSVKNHVTIVHEELASLKPFVLQYDFELQVKEDNRLKDIKTQIVNVIHYAAYITNLCPSRSLSIWYAILCLPNVIHHIKLVKFEVEKIKDDHMYTSKKVTGEIESSDVLPQQATTSKHEGAFIGFKQCVESILDDLQGGRKDLTIISISGMPGQGKTTLARRIYDDPSIQYYFHKFAWVSVTKECKIRKLFTDLLGCDIEFKDYGNLKVHDLADRVRKSLKGRKYFIVLDDIWDADVWSQVQYSFPDDENGSRILFTSRNHDLASQCKRNSISHRLPLFSYQESWELMKEKLACSDGFPEELLQVGKQIAVYCKGLPLAVVLIASHLNDTRQELDLWMDVAKNMKSRLASEGCMHILELSYKYLPQHLKPCFLYFGSAFRRGEYIHAKKLIRLWIAEGFINGNEMMCPEDLGKEYLDYLVSQNLIQVIERGSMGNINFFTVHDLLYDLCIQKSFEENFLDLVDYREIQDESHDSISYKYNFQHHCVCIRDMDPTFTHLTSCCTQKELLPRSPVHSLFWSHRDIVQDQCKSLFLFFSNFRVLTVLDMTDVTLKGSMFAIRTLLLSNIHLRYLGLRGYFSHAPLLMDKLWNLETLILIPYGNVLSLPRSLFETKSLSYISVGLSCINLNGSVSMTAPASNVESLKGILVQYDVETREFLRSLPKLRNLKCYYEVGCPELLCMFESLEKLENLRIISIEKVISEGLLYPSIGFHLPNTLKKLCLWGLRLPWNAMSTIGKLSHLEVLKLVKNACKGPTWNLGDEEFSRLKYLRLMGLNIERIDDSGCDSPPFPCLEKFDIISCDKLIEVPASFGDIYTLKRIFLCASPKVLNSIEVIFKQQGAMGNGDLQLVFKSLHPFVLEDENDDQGEKEKVEIDNSDGRGGRYAPVKMAIDTVFTMAKKILLQDKGNAQSC